MARGVSHRLAFVVLSGRRWCPGCRREPGSSSTRSRRAAAPRGARWPTRLRALVPLVGPVCWARSSTSASGRSRSRRAASGHDRNGRPTGPWPIHRATVAAWALVVAEGRGRRGRRDRRRPMTVREPAAGAREHDWMSRPQRHLSWAQDARAGRRVGSLPAAGERVGVAGRTGAGKSTLALAAAGFIPRVVRAAVRGRARRSASSTRPRRVPPRSAGWGSSSRRPPTSSRPPS